MLRISFVLGIYLLIIHSAYCNLYLILMFIYNGATVLLYCSVFVVAHFHINMYSINVSSILAFEKK